MTALGFARARVFNMPISPKLGPEAAAANMAEIAPLYTRQEALLEANRCLFCFDAPCIQACPTGIDVPSFIKKIANGNPTGAARTILSANILGASCARVCPTEVLCEGACVLDDRDLNLERIKFESQREQLVRQYHQALGNREPAQVRIVEAQIEQAKAQLALLQDRLTRTRVVAPFDAVVDTVRRLVEAQPATPPHG